MGADGLTRRGFLKLTGSGIVAATIVPASVLGAAAPSNLVAVASIGVGGQGGGLLGSLVRLTNDCRVVAVCDCFQDRREKAASIVEAGYGRLAGSGTYAGCKKIPDFRDVLAREDVDAVVVATPDHWHAPIGIAAARAGKDMYIEKPVGLALGWDLALRDVVHRYGRIFHYGAQQRSSAHFRFGCELVRNGYLGELKAVEVQCPGGIRGGSLTATPAPGGFDFDMWLGPAPAVPYTRDRCTNNGAWHCSDYALGFIAGWGAHPLDIALWGLGDGPDAVPIEYEGTGVFPQDGLYNTALAWDIRGKYANGVAFRFRGPGQNTTTFIGTEGTLALSRYGKRFMPDPASLATVKIKPDEIHLPVSMNHRQAFLQGVRTRKQTVSNIDVAVRSDAMSHLSDIAMRTGRKIKWDPKAERILGDPAAERYLTRPMREPWSI